MTLDESLASGQPGHLSDHGTLHSTYNDSLVNRNIQYVAVPADGGDDANDGFTWGTAKATVKAACTLVTAATGGIVNIGIGTFVEEGNIPWNRGVRIEGTAVNGTQIQLKDGENEHLFVSEPGLIGTEFLHWAHIRNMRIRGSNDVADGKDLIRFDSRVGENCRIENVILHPGKNGVGIHTTRGGQPIFWNDIHSFVAAPPDSGAAAIYLERQPGDIFQSVVLQNISGDNHLDALIHARGFYNENIETLTIIGMKSESGFGQLASVWLDDMQCQVTIIGGSVFDVGGSPDAFVKITGPTQSNVSVNMIGCAGAPDKWINDTSIWLTEIPRLPGAEKVSYLHYRYGIIQFRLSDTSNQELRPVRVEALALADSAKFAPLTVAGQDAIFVDPIDGDLMILFGDGTLKTIVTDS